MKISLIQTSLVWEDHEANRANFENLIGTIKGSTDLIILPEMFATGFTMDPAPVAETMDGETINWMKRMAAQKDCAITGSLVIKEDGNYYNRLLFVTPDGAVQHYNKRHLFSLAGEDKAYTKGKEKLIVDFRDWKICLQVCYDLRFPVFSRNVEEYDLLVYVANWPSPRLLAWDTLLRARAIENMCYVAGVNRVGQDKNAHSYPGHSQVLDGLGAHVKEPSGDEVVFTVEIDKESLYAMRGKFAFLNDRDSFTLLS